MDYYRNKLVLITGGSSGIGLSLAKQLAESEANVWILARRPDILETALNEIESCRKNSEQKFGCIQADVTNEQETNRELVTFIKSVGLPDILINSAGSSRPGMFIEQSNEIFHQMMDLNYFGTVNVVKIIAPGMMHRRSGHIINITSMGGYIGAIGYSAYSASKFAVRGFTDSIRPEMKEYNVRISLVYPPDTRTPGQAVEDTFKPPVTKVLEEDNTGIAEPDDIAKAILKEVARGKYNIFPSFASRSWFLVYGFVGMTLNLLNPVMDMLVERARRKVEKQNGHH